MWYSSTVWVVMVRIKCSGEEVRVGVTDDNIFVVITFAPGSGWTSSWPWEVVMNILFCFASIRIFSSHIELSFDPWVSCFCPLFVWYISVVGTEKVTGWKCGHLFGSTHHSNIYSIGNNPWYCSETFLNKSVKRSSGKTLFLKNALKPESSKNKAKIGNDDKVMFRWNREAYMQNYQTPILCSCPDDL